MSETATTHQEQHSHTTLSKMMLVHVASHVPKKESKKTRSSSMQFKSGDTCTALRVAVTIMAAPFSKK